jgi:hypothetical protein
MRESPIAWTRSEIAGRPTRRAVGHVGEVEVGAVEFDPGNRLWLWSSPLADEAWGWAPSEEGARQALEVWLRAWLAPFRPFFQP